MFTPPASLIVGFMSASTQLLIPSELFSPLISQKVLATAQTNRSPPQYPQWTDRTSGQWQWFSPDTWTIGFFPSTLYALDTRNKLCKKASAADKTLSGTDWVGLGRQWSAAEVPLQVKTGVGHDVGFLSFPFTDELAMYVFFSSTLLFPIHRHCQN